MCRKVISAFSNVSTRPCRLEMERPCLRSRSDLKHSNKFTASDPQVSFLIKSSYRKIGWAELLKFILWLRLRRNLNLLGYNCAYFCCLLLLCLRGILVHNIYWYSLWFGEVDIDIHLRFSSAHNYTERLICYFSLAIPSHVRRVYSVQLLPRKVFTCCC